MVCPWLIRFSDELSGNRGLSLVDLSLVDSSTIKLILKNLSVEDVILLTLPMNWLLTIDENGVYSSYTCRIVNKEDWIWEQGCPPLREVVHLFGKQQRYDRYEVHTACYPPL